MSDLYDPDFDGPYAPRPFLDEEEWDDASPLLDDIVQGSGTLGKLGCMAILLFVTIVGTLLVFDRFFRGVEDRDEPQREVPGTVIAGGGTSPMLNVVPLVVTRTTLGDTSRPMLEPGTAVSILNQNQWDFRVRVESGRHAGRTGWVTRGYVDAPGMAPEGDSAKPHR